MGKPEPQDKFHAEWTGKRGMRCLHLQGLSLTLSLKMEADHKQHLCGLPVVRRP
jgi:hypothetical protein